MADRYQTAREISNKNATLNKDYEKRLASAVQHVNQVKNEPRITPATIKVPQQRAVSTTNMAEQMKSTIPSASQILLRQPVQNKWYKGETPTASEIDARIYQIGQTDKKQGEELWTAWQGMRQDKSSPYYQPYVVPTNQAIQEMENLGFDMSKGVTQEWLDEHSYLKNYYRLGTGGTPLAPSKTSTPEENAAYWYHHLLTAEETTTKAELEAKALREEISYWANREDRNLTDDEILAMFDWKKYPTLAKKYPTLAKMNADRKAGTPTILNRAIDYDPDQLDGMIWAARNGSSGNSAIDSVHAVLGDGIGYKENKDITAKRKKESDSYSPYSLGSTLDDAASYFGVQDFSPEWVRDHMYMLDSMDETEQKMFLKVYQAEQTTVQAQKELDDLWAHIDEEIGLGMSSDMIMQDVLKGYDTLKRLDKSIDNKGDLVGTTRAIDFSMNELRAEVERRCAAEEAKQSGFDFAENANSVLSGYKDLAEYVGTGLYNLGKMAWDGYKENLSNGQTTVDQAPGKSKVSPEAVKDTAGTENKIASASPMTIPHSDDEEEISAKEIGIPNSTFKSYVTSKAEQAVIQAKEMTAAAVAPIIMMKGTDAEKAVFQGGALDLNRLSEVVKNGIEYGKAAFGYGFAKNKFDQDVKTNYLGVLEDVAPYIETEGKLADQRKEAERLTEELKKLESDHEKYTTEYDRIMTEKPYGSTTIRVYGVPYRVDAVEDPETDSYVLGSIERLPQPEDSIAPQQLLWDTGDELSSIIRDYDPTEEGAKSDQDVWNNELYPLLDKYAKIYGLSNEQIEDQVADIESDLRDKWLQYYYDPEYAATAVEEYGDNVNIPEMLLYDALEEIKALAPEGEWEAQSPVDDDAIREEAERWVGGLDRPSMHMKPTEDEATAENSAYENKKAELTKKMSDCQTEIAWLERDLKEQEAAYNKSKDAYSQLMSDQQALVDMQKKLGATSSVEPDASDYISFIYANGKEYHPQWLPYTRYQYMQQDGNYTPQQIQEQAVKDIQDIERCVAELDKAISWLDANKEKEEDLVPAQRSMFDMSPRRAEDMVTPAMQRQNRMDQYRGNLVKKRDELLRDKEAAQYELKSFDPVFKRDAYLEREAALMAYLTEAEANSYANEHEEDWHEAGINRQEVYDEAKKLHDLIWTQPYFNGNGPYDGAVMEIANAAMPFRGDLGDAFTLNYAMTEDEQLRYFGILRQEGKDAAYDYYKYLTDEDYGVLVTRDAQTRDEVTREFAEEYPVLASVTAVGLTPFKLASIPYIVTQSGQGKDINPNAWAFAASSASKVATSTANQQIEEQYGHIAGTFHSGLVSGAQSWLNNALFGWGGLLAMGAEAAADTVQDVKYRGGSNEQALLMGSLNGACEMATEYITFNNMAKLAHMGVKEGSTFLTTMLKDIFLEEIPGELLNDIAEGALDTAIMGDLSEAKMQMNAYRYEDHLTPEEADLAASRKFASGLMDTALSTFFSAGLTDSIGYGSHLIKGTPFSTVIVDAYKNIGLRGMDAIPSILEMANAGYTPTSDRMSNKTVDGIKRLIAKAKRQNMTMDEIKTLVNQKLFKKGDARVSDTMGAANNVAQENLQQEMEKVTKAASVLTSATGTRTSAQIVALSAALSTGKDNQDVANAAAYMLNRKYGGEKAVRLVRDIMLSAVEQGYEMNDTVTALAMAATTGAASSDVLNSMVENGITSQSIENFFKASQQDAANESVLNDMERNVVENRVGIRTYERAAEGALDSAKDDSADVVTAIIGLDKANDVLENEQHTFDEMAESMQDAVQKYLENPGDQDAEAQKTKALEAYKGQKAVVEQAKQTVEDAQQRVEEAQRKADEAADMELTAARQMAETEVVTEDQARAEEAARLDEERIAREQADAEAAEAAEIQDNVSTFDAESFADVLREQGYDVNDADMRKIQKTAKKIAKEIEADNQQRYTFAKQVAQKYGINIAFTDTTRGGKVSRQNGFWNPGTNTIVLDNTATVGDAVYAVLGHELTHVAEKAGTYGDMAMALLKLQYKGLTGTFEQLIKNIENGTDHSQLAATILARQQFYNDRLAQMHEQDASIDAGELSVMDAAQEVVADVTGEILRGNQELARRLAGESPSVARRILDSIKSFLRRLTGVKGNWKDDIQKAVDMLESALNEAQEQRGEGETKYSIGKTSDGRQFVDVDVDQGIFDNLTPKQLLLKAKSIINERFKGLVVDFADGNATVTKRTAEEYARPANRRLPDNIREAKGRASTELNSLLETSEQILPGDPDYPTAQYNNHHNNANRWSYYRTLFRVGGEQFKGTICIARMDDFSRVHDITHIQNDTSWTALQGNEPQGASAGIIKNNIAQDEPVVKPLVKDNQGNDLADELRGGTAIKSSLSSWTPEEQVRVRDSLIKRGFAEADVNKWIGDANGIAATIAADKTRLDFTADPTKTMLKPNAEYVKTLDASTLCAKRLLYQGTFNAIQHLLPNTPLMPTDLIDLSNMMREMGYETPCGICYVESRRRNLGKFAADWLENYQGAYKPTLDEVTTSDGLQKLKETHPDTAQDFINAMNKKGTMNPKVVQLRTDYRGEISEMTPGQVQKVKDIGGLRVQSFSDFEVPHLLDMVQAVMDMSAKELTSQAYTKVPAFAWVFGDTGIKINLSLIGKGEGVDANGNLLFDDVEGMPFEEAMRIRDRYSKNVGTILVGINDAHILAAMADDRIDFIIPFHKSGWSKEELAKMPVLDSYSDYTDSQNEKKIVGRTKNGGYKTESLEKSKQVNFQPVGENGYWDFNKSGKENAETYLKMCAEDGRLPKFSQFLVDNGDGSFSLQPDGSTDGYWKTLIDFKMYDNDGVGSPQMAVTPNVNMEEANRVLNDYSLDRNGIVREDNDSLPVAQPVVERYVEEYKQKNPGRKYSLPSPEVQEAAEKAFENSKVRTEDGKLMPVYHGTSADFNVFDTSISGGKNGTQEGYGIYLTDNPEISKQYGGRTISAYVNMERPAYADKQTIKRSELAKVIKATCEKEAQSFVDEGSYDNVSDAIKDTWISNYVYTPEYKSINDAYNAVANLILEQNDNDSDIVGELLIGLGIRDYKLAMDFYHSILTPLTGIDGIWAKWTNRQNGEVSNVLLAFDSSQIKSNEDVTYDDQGNVIPLSERFNQANNDIRYSLPSDPDLENMIREYLLNGGMLSRNTMPSAKALPGFAGQSNQGNRQRQFGRQTAQSSDALHQEVKDYLYTHSNYTPDTNAAQIDRSIAWVQDHANDADTEGYYGAVREVESPNFDYRSADGQARMLTLMGMAALKGDIATEMRLADAYNKQGTDLGRMLQARKIFRLMTPLGRQSYLQKQVDEINAEYGRKGSKRRVALSEGTMRAAAEAKTEQEFQAVQQAANKELADQMPANWKDKLRGWRMLSMLGNPRTHIRNILGNALFMPAVGIKNKIAALGEIIDPKVKAGERTKILWLASPEARAFAKQDALTVKDDLTGEAKYKDKNGVQSERKTWGTGKGPISKTLGKALQAVSDFNGNALEFEDWIFLKRHYRNALAGYMTANKLKAADMTGDTLEKARIYAIQEAQKATYRDANKLAETLSRIGREGGVPGFFVNAVLPFKKTPANILKRGIEYSPVGLLNALVVDGIHMKQYLDFQKGKLSVLPVKAISPAQWIDKISAGLTGTGIMALGALLASLGVVSVGMGDDDDEFDKLRGKQQYAINLNLFGHDVSITADWAAPVSMPFFVGATVYDTVEKMVNGGDVDVGKLAEAMLDISEPVFNLSMLDGVNSLLDTNSYGEGNTLTQIGEKILTNYATSYVPTIVGQAARTIDTTRRKAFVESGSSFQTERYAWEKLENKLPFLSMSNIPYRDVWGNVDESYTLGAGLENFLSPAYINEIKDDFVVDELERLYKETKDSVAVPKMPAKIVGGEKVTAEEYDRITVDRGQAAHETLEGLFKSSEYQMADAETKLKMVELAWKYATQTANNKAFGSKMDKWISEAGDPVQAIIDKTVESNQKAQETGYKKAMVESINNNDIEAALTSVEALRRSGLTDQKIKDYLGNQYRDLYKEAFLAGDRETVAEISRNLLAMNVGFTTELFKKWQNDAKKK